ncbi:MAG: sugar transferase [Burkholderiales bacterium]
MQSFVALSSDNADDLAERGTGLKDYTFVAPTAAEVDTAAIAVRSCSGLPVTFLRGMPVAPEISGRRVVHLVLKRAMDIILGLAALLALGPFLLATAIIIRATSKGPALFRQDRDGLNGAVISVYKFRSMHTELGDASGVQQTRAGDSRITPFGRFIRRTSIDELPQLLNVIKGDMSLIGPRPHPIGMLASGEPYETVVPYYHARHVMRPGISGWAQANGLRGPTTDSDVARARVDHDLAYIQNFSVLLDIKIIIRTVIREFVTGSGL